MPRYRHGVHFQTSLGFHHALGNLHCATGQPPAEARGRRPIYTVEIGKIYPKIFTIDRVPADGELLILTVRGQPNASFTVKQSFHVGDVLQLPHQFAEMNISTPLALEFCIYKGVLLWNLQQEIRLYQELITHLAVEGYLDPEKVAPKYDKIVKLMALADGNKSAGEKDACTARAIEMSRRLLIEERKEP